MGQLPEEHWELIELGLRWFVPPSAGAARTSRARSCGRGARRTVAPVHLGARLPRRRDAPGFPWM